MLAGERHSFASDVFSYGVVLFGGCRCSCMALGLSGQPPCCKTSKLAVPGLRLPTNMRGGHAALRLPALPPPYIRTPDPLTSCPAELLTLQSPWSATPNPWQITTHLLEGRRPPIPPAEELVRTAKGATLEGVHALIHLVEQCWAQDPQLRPSFDDIVPELR